MYRNRVSSCIPVGLAWFLTACAANIVGPSRGLDSQEQNGDSAGENRSSANIAELAARAAVVNVEPNARTDDDTVCTKESVTGSHRSRTVCRTQAERRAVRSAAQEWFRTGGREGEVSRVPTVQ
jgi:hypothetical protein